MTAFTFHNIVPLTLALLQPTEGKEDEKKKEKKNQLQDDKCLCRCLMLM